MTKIILFFSLLTLNAFCCTKQDGIKAGHSLIKATAQAFRARTYNMGPDLLPFNREYDHIPYSLFFKDDEVEIGKVLVHKEFCYSIPGPTNRKNRNPY